MVECQEIGAVMNGITVMAKRGLLVKRGNDSDVKSSQLNPKNDAEMTNWVIYFEPKNYSLNHNSPDEPDYCDMKHNDWETLINSV